jgi:hypothetical protein
MARISTAAARRAGPVILLVGLALGAAACGAGKKHASVASLPKGGTSTSARAAKGDPVKYAACMRSHGVAKFPDPGADGSFTFQSGQGVDVNSDQFKAADEACKSFAPTGGNPPGAKKIDPAEQRQYLAFASCMRSHGIADYPDPKTKDDGSLDMLLPKNMDINSPQFKAAEQACKSVLPAGGQPPGTGS